MHQYMLGVEQGCLEKEMQRRDLGFLVNTNLPINQQWALDPKAANTFHGCIRQCSQKVQKSHGTIWIHN